jgi:hypothetical protein
MSGKVGTAFVIEDEEPQQCDMCGEIGELRPYGPPGARMVCFTCGMKDEETTKQRFLEGS